MTVVSQPAIGHVDPRFLITLGMKNMPCCAAPQSSHSLDSTLRFIPSCHQRSDSDLRSANKDVEIGIGLPREWPFSAPSL
jgi:hypothetical protein